RISNASTRIAPSALRGLRRSERGVMGDAGSGEAWPRAEHSAADPRGARSRRVRRPARRRGTLRRGRVTVPRAFGALRARIPLPSVTKDPPSARGGTLYLVGTPIGNLEDITHRALRILGEVEVVAAEDTRHTRRLLDRYGIAAQLVSLFEHNER